jgi:hypothetical protein
MSESDNVGVVSDSGAALEGAPVEDTDVPVVASGKPSPSEEIAALRIEILALKAKVEDLEGKLSAFRPVHQPKWDADNHRFTEDEFSDEGR